MSQGSGKTRAFIPARGGSLRLPHKNLTEVLGKPIMAYTIQEALDSGVYDEVWVNSDDDRILAVAERFSALTYKRPPALGQPKVFVVDVLKEMIASLGWADQDEVAVLFPTVPLRSAEDIRQAHQLFRAHGGDSPVASVTAFEYPVQVALSLDGDGRLEPAFPDAYYTSTRHDDHKPLLRANYGIVINRAGVFRDQKTLVGKRALPYEMPPERSVDIDYDYQLRYAEFLLTQRERSHG